MQGELMHILECNLILFGVKLHVECILKTQKCLKHLAVVMESKYRMHLSIQVEGGRWFRCCDTSASG